MALNELLESYYENKSKMDALKPIVDKQNKEIKANMLNENLTEYTYNGIVAKYSVSSKVSMDEDKLLAILMECADEIPVTIVKTKPYVDMESLESALYNDVIPDHIKKRLAECNTTKETVTLRVTKKLNE